MAPPGFFTCKFTSLGIPSMRLLRLMMLDYDVTCRFIGLLELTLRW
jgi:hypothetical protein